MPQEHVCDKEADIATIKADTAHTRKLVESLTKNLFGVDDKGGALTQIRVNKSSLVRVWLCIGGMITVILTQIGLG